FGKNIRFIFKKRSFQVTRVFGKMKFVSMLILLSFCSRGGANNGLQILKDAIHAIDLQQSMNKPCDFTMLERYYAINWCVQGSPPCHTICNIKSQDYVTGEACCIAGRWNITGNLDGLKRRRKRGWGFVGGIVNSVVGIVRNVVCIFICIQATDEKGYTTYCSFNLRVQVTRCGNAIWPQNGYRSCDSSDPIYGTQCTFDCNDGYELNGYQMTECQADGTWSGLNNQRCTNKEPPVITSCLTHQSFYADAGTTKYNVMWVKPEAEDSIDGTNIQLIQDDDSPRFGSNISSGLTLVQYYAVDTKGNKSPKCYIFLEVKIITCLHPYTQFLDNNLKFSCKSLNVGDTCSVSCRSNLPLLGDNNITCTAQNGALTGIWTWINEPECLVVKCHDLNPPDNGALVCDSINTRPFCQMFCNDNHDITYSFDGRYFCQDSGNWSPSDTVPGCTAKKRTNIFLLRSDFLYFSGNCSDQSTLDLLGRTFENITAGLPVGYICKGCRFDNVKVTCGKVTKRRKRSQQRNAFIRTPSVSHNMLPTLNDSSRRKRQTDATFKTTIEFNIVVPWNQGNMSLLDAYDHHDNITFTFRDILISMVNAGNFTLPGYYGPQYQFEDYGSLQCDDGFLDGGICRTCSMGMEYNETTQSCQKCPLHTYKDYDGVSACQACPSGHIALETGRKYLNECIELCPIGTFSEETVVPCTPCPVGSYQKSIGQKTCIACPDGKTTNSSGSTSEAACNYFDIFVNTEISQLLRNVSEDVKNLTVALRFQINGKDSGVPHFSFYASHATEGEYLYISLQDTVSVLVGQSLHSSTTNIEQGKWTLLILSLESTRQLLSMTLDGQTVLQEQPILGFNDTFLKAGSSILMKVGSNTTVGFTELFMINKILSPDELASVSSSCKHQISSSFLSMSVFAGMHVSGLHFVVPSTCYAVDECSSNPCGNHTCINSAAGFVCRCLHGYSGPTCATAPDLCKENECRNGATCINNGMDYNCSCLPGYSGVFCEMAPVNGNWSEWTVWTVCSVSCGGGSMSRSRRCDSPSPGSYGLNCTGQEHETEICNMEDCPVCPELPLGNGTKIEVKVENGTEIRTIKCQDGLAFAPGFEPNQEYKCGISTNYKWTHTSTLNPLGRTPSCTGVIGPRMITTSTTITYETLPCSASSLAETTISEKLQSLQCVSNNTCNLTLSTSCSINGTVTATIALTSSLDGAENLDLPALYENNTVSDNLMKLVQAITELELSTQKLVNETAADLSVQVYNNTHRVDVKNIGTKAIVDCPTGLVASSGMCVECPLGTYYDSSTSSCHICDLGTYQDESAQSACKPCLAGYTTVGEGSVSVQDCI
ncbi:hypothetical protein CHS0354_004438, partial [Potamilus streckersoni]